MHLISNKTYTRFKDLEKINLQLKNEIQRKEFQIQKRHKKLIKIEKVLEDKLNPNPNKINKETLQFIIKDIQDILINN